MKRCYVVTPDPTMRSGKGPTASAWYVMAASPGEALRFVRKRAPGYVGTARIDYPPGDIFAKAKKLK